MSAVRRWFDSLKPRERLVVQAGVVVLCLIVLTAGLLMPLHASVNRAREEVRTHRTDLAWMQQHAPEIQASAGGFVAGSDESPVVLIDRTGHEAGLSDSLRGTQPSESGVRVQLESAPFDAMVGWIGTLGQRHGMAIESITVDRTVRPGLVNASITFTQNRH